MEKRKLSKFYESVVFFVTLVAISAGIVGLIEIAKYYLLNL